MKVFAYGAKIRDQKLISRRRSKNQYGEYRRKAGARVAQSLGVPREQMITLICQKIPKKKLGSERGRLAKIALFLLVTSASAAGDDLLAGGL